MISSNLGLIDFNIKPNILLFMMLKNNGLNTGGIIKEFRILWVLPSFHKRVLKKEKLLIMSLKTISITLFSKVMEDLLRANINEMTVLEALILNNQLSIGSPQQIFQILTLNLKLVLTKFRI